MKKQERLQKLILQLNDKEESVFDKALDDLAADGDLSIMAPLSEVLFETKIRSRKTKISAFFSDIEHEPAKIEFMRVMGELTEDAKQAELLNTIWNSRMDFSEYLVDFVELAIDGSFETAIECHTIIENMDGPFDEADILECQLLLGTYESHPKRNKQKDLLIHDIASFLGEMDTEVEG